MKYITLLNLKTIFLFLIFIIVPGFAAAQKVIKLTDIPPQIVKLNEIMSLKITDVPDGKKLSLVSVREDLSHIDIHLDQDNLLTYKPSISDYFEFKIGLKYGDKIDTINITPYHSPTHEYDYVQNQTPIPNALSNAYNEIQSTKSTKENSWNHDSATPRKVSMIGKVIIIDPTSSNKYFNVLRSTSHDSIGNHDIESLKIDCDTLILKTKLWLPQTSITIKCKNILIYPADSSDAAKNIKGFLVTTPLKFPIGVKESDIGINGQPGLPGGDITINCKNITNKSGEKILFVANGGKGQTGGPGKDGAIITDPIGKTYEGSAYDFGNPDLNLRFHYKINNVIYEEADNGQVLYGSKSIVPKNGGNAQLPGYGGEGGKPGYVSINIENYSAISDRNIQAVTGEFGDIFSSDASEVRTYQGGEGQSANWIIGNGPPYPRDPCNNCTRLFRTLVLTPKKGETGNSFPTAVPDHFKSFIQLKNIRDSIKRIAKPFKDLGLVSYNPIYKDTDGDGFYDNCTVIGHFWYDDGNPLGFPLTEDRQIATVVITNYFDKSVDNLDDVRAFYKYYFSKPHFDSLAASSPQTIKPLIIKDQSSHWLSSLAVEKDLVYIKDLYMSGNFSQTRKFLDSLISNLNNATKDANGESYIALSNELASANALLYRLNSNLDFFGNPAGYCPLLSFWVNKLLYSHGVDESIHDIILSRRILQLNQSSQLQEQDMGKLIDNNWNQIESERYDLSDAMATLSGLSDEAENISATIDNLERDIQAMQESFLAAATTNVILATQVPAWKKAGHVLAIACKVIPVYQPALAAIGEGIDLATKYDEQKPLTTIEQAADIYQRLSSKTFQESAQDFKSKLDSFKRNGRDIVTYGKDLYKLYNQTYAPAFTEIINAAKDNEVDAKQVMDMLEEIKQQDTTYSKLAKKIQDLTERKVKLIEDIKQALNTMSTLQSDISSKLVQVNSLEEAKRTISNSALSNDAKNTLSSTEENAFADLLALRYNMAKSYEYRFLKPYADPLTYKDIFDEIDTFLSHQSATEKDSLLITGIKAIYTAKLRQILQDFVSKMNQERFTYQNQTFDFSVSPEMLSTLNQKGQVDLQLPKDIIGFIGSTSNKTFTLLDSVSVKSLELQTGASIPGNVNITTQMADNISIIGYKDEKKIFRLGNGNTPILFSTCSYNPSTGSYHNSTFSNDINEFSAITGISTASISDPSNFSSFFNKPSLQTKLRVEIDNATSGVKLKALNFQLKYAFIPVNNLKTLQMLTNNSNLLYVIANNTSGKIYYFTGEVNKVFLSTDRIKITVPKFFNNQRFHHWENYSGINIGTDTELLLPNSSSYTSLRPVYQ
jgi:hypothetical protein